MTITPLTIGASLSGTDRTVRPAVASDAPLIARVQLAALYEAAAAADGGEAEDIRGGLPNEQELAGQWQATLAGRAPEGCVTLVAIHGMTVGGFALAIPGEELAEIPGKRPVIEAGTEIAALEVDANFRRSGHASRLISAVKDTVGRNNLRIWVSSTDEARQQFVQSAGFAPAGVRRHLKVGQGSITEHLWWAQI